jgi:hypothetical protein
MKRLLLFPLVFSGLSALAQNPSFTVQNIAVSGQKGCVVDMNGDFLDDIVGVATSGTSVAVKYQQQDGSFTAATLPTPDANFLPSWSIAAGDINNDGRTDLLYGSGNGVTFMVQNPDGSGFTELSGPQDIFSQRSNFADLNGDQWLDAFVCHDVEPNVYYTNDGDGTLTFHQGGLGDYVNGGNYGSIWVDYDNDGDSDLFIAKCRGGSSPAKVDELHRNNGDGTFTNVSAAAGMAEPSQSWSSAWGDFDNDGDMDALIGASSFSDGGHKLRRNNGDGTFTDVTAGSGYQAFTGAGHEYVAHDFNNDGWIDVLGPSASGFACTIMLNNGNMTFTPVPISAGSGPVCDLNNDGFLDIQNDNNVYFNTGNPNKWLKLNLQGVQSNRMGIGARIEIYGPWGIQIRDVRSGDGFRYMSSINAHFGIGAATEIEKVIVRWPSGIVDQILSPEPNQSLFVLEGSSQLAVNQPGASAFSLYPNPAHEWIAVSLAEGMTAEHADIFDLTGKKVLSADLDGSLVNVQKLATGTYIMLLRTAEGKKFSQQFIKN